MTRLRMASLFVAVVAGDYAALMLINGQLTDFGVTAAICAGSVVAAGLSTYAGRRRCEAVARGRAAVWERRDRQTAAAQQCPLCGGVRQKQSESPRFVDRQGARLCAACAPAPDLERKQPERVRRSTSSTTFTSSEFNCGRGAPDDPGVEVLT